MIHLHQEDGTGISLRKERILVVKQRPGGGCTLTMRGGTYYTVEESYEDVTRWLEDSQKQSQKP